MVQQILEIQFEIEMYEITRLNDMMDQDATKKACLIY